LDFVFIKAGSSYHNIVYDLVGRGVRFMKTFFTEVRQTLVPYSEVKYGPLPPLLIAMTLNTGLVDAFSFLVLGHVFVANMTGNVVFLALASAGVSGFSIPHTLVALVSFVLGTLVGGFLGSRLGQHRGRFLSVATALQTLLLGVSVVIIVLSGNPLPTGSSYGLIIVLAIAMALQNVTARKLAVPDLTTTVLTSTIVGIGADNRLVGGSGSRAGRRLMAVVALFIGALIGGLLIIHVSIVSPLVVALIVTAIIAVTARMLSRMDPAWVRTS
jgi:uncharacterized membrane protein YoaK (UPF0700 family)